MSSEPLQQPHARLDVGLAHAALLGGVLVILADHAEPAVERRLLSFDDRHGDADVEEIHRDAAAHRAGADHADLLDGQRRRVVGDIGDLPDLALGEEHVALRLRLRRRQQFQKRRALALDAFVERQFDRVADRADRALPGLEAAEFLRVGLADRVEDFRLAARGKDLVFEVAHFSKRHLLVDRLARERERAFAQLALLDEPVDHAAFKRLLRGDRRSRKDRLERRFRADQARQALRAAGAGDQAELDFRQADFCARDRDPIMRDQRDLEAAAERRAVDRRDDGLSAILDRRLRLRQARPAHRLAEFGDVGAGDEGAAGADQHDRLGGGIGRRLGDAIAQRVAHPRRKRIDRRRVDGQDGDVAFHAEIGDSVDGGHEHSSRSVSWLWLQARAGNWQDA